MFRFAVLFAAALACSLPVSAAPSPLEKLLPTSAAVKNWNVYEGTRAYAASADKLSVIYDGGDMPYIKAGCVEAIQQSYRNAQTKHIATLIIHRMKTPAKAKALYESWRKDVAKKPGFKQLAGLKDAGYLFTSLGTNSTCGYRDKYFVRVDVAGTTAADKFAASLLLRDVLGKVKPKR